MIAALHLLLAPLAPVPADDPPVRLWLSSDARYLPGDRARVRVEAAADGYLVVLRADGSGRVRMLFPLDPGDDAFVRGGREYELRGRGDRDAFFVDDREGTGIVLAAWSRDPFRFDEFVRADHWDYRTLSPVTDDPEAGLLDIVHRMAGPEGAGARFEYDEVRYSVGDATAYYGGYGSPHGVGMSLSFGYPSYPYFYDPFCYAPWWGCSGFAFGVGHGYPFPYGYPVYPYPYRYRAPHVGGTVFGRPGRSGSQYFVPRNREIVRPVEPRRRVADAGDRRESAPARVERSAPRRGVVRPSDPGIRRPAVAPRGSGRSSSGRTITSPRTSRSVAVRGKR
ncbi:MAG: DUF4384 domain-containing protein [Gemmatimonadales bacterium]